MSSNKPLSVQKNIAAIYIEAKGEMVKRRCVRSHLTAQISSTECGAFHVKSRLEERRCERWKSENYPANAGNGKARSLRKAVITPALPGYLL